MTKYINFFPGSVRDERELTITDDAAYGLYAIDDLVDAIIGGSTCSTVLDGVKGALEDGSLWADLCRKHGDGAVQDALEELHGLVAEIRDDE